MDFIKRNIIPRKKVVERKRYCLNYVRGWYF